MRYAIIYLPAEKPGTTEILAHAFDKMVTEGLLSRVFYDGTVRTKDEFIADVLRPGSLPFAIMAGDEIASFTWLNSLEGRSGRGHLVFFRKFWGRKYTTSIGRRHFRYLLSRRDARGYLFDSIIGITPKNNPLAWTFGLNCGCIMVGTIPSYLYIAEEDKSVDAVVTATTRELMGVRPGEVTEAVWEE